MSDDEWVRSRLPVRTITAWPEVHERLSAPERLREEGVVAGETGDGTTVAVRPTAHVLEEAHAHGLDGDDTLPRPTTGAGPAKTSDEAGPTQSAEDDALTDWQRQWLSLDGPDEPDIIEEEADLQENWWEDIPAVRQLLLEGLELGPATVLLGENGSGKSTLAEGIAMAYGLAPEGGSTGSRHRTRDTESGLGDQLQIIRNAGAGRSGYFLRAETMHAFFSYLADNPGKDPEEPLFHQLSHGESFVALVEVKFKVKRPGLYVLDEPESALSFDNQLRLLRHLRMLVETGRHQIVMATHSPILAALPGATILEVDEQGFHEVDHDDAVLVRQWRHFMNDSASFLDG